MLFSRETVKNNKRWKQHQLQKRKSISHFMGRHDFWKTRSKERIAKSLKTLSVDPRKFTLYDVSEHPAFKEAGYSK